MNYYTAIANHMAKYADAKLRARQARRQYREALRERSGSVAVYHVRAVNRRLDQRAAWVQLHRMLGGLPDGHPFK